MRHINKSRVETENSIKKGWKTILSVIIADVILTTYILIVGNVNLFLTINLGISLSPFEPVIALIANFGAILLLAGGLLVFIFDPKYRSREALILTVIGFWVAIFLGYSLKTYFSVLRPYEQIAYTRTLIYTAPELGGAFPSSHALIAFFVWTIIAVKAKRYTAPTLLLASLMAFSRIYVGVHYPLDISIGILLGILIAVALLTVEVGIEYFKSRDLR